MDVLDAPVLIYRPIIYNISFAYNGHIYIYIYIYIVHMEHVFVYRRWPIHVLLCVSVRVSVRAYVFVHMCTREQT